MTVQYADSDYLDDDVANTLEAAEDSSEPGAPEVLPINEFLPDASPTAPRQPREYEEDPQIRTADAEALKREADEYFRRKQYVAARSTYEDAQRVLRHEDVTDDAGDAARVASGDINAACGRPSCSTSRSRHRGDPGCGRASTAPLDAPTTTRLARVKGLAAARSRS